VTLELGGKSLVYIDSSADMELTELTVSYWAMYVHLVILLCLILHFVYIGRQPTGT
jgi:hypothetical protein